MLAQGGYGELAGSDRGTPDNLRECTALEGLFILTSIVRLPLKSKSVSSILLIRLYSLALLTLEQAKTLLNVAETVAWHSYDALEPYHSFPIVYVRSKSTDILCK